MIKKIKPIHVYNKTYRQNYYIYYGIPLSDYLKDFEKQTGVPEDLDPDVNYQGRCTLVDDLSGCSVIFIWVKDKDIGILAHEILHAVSFTLNTRDISFNDDTEEIYAYLLSMLIREVI